MLPKLICLDFETALVDGTPSVDFYRPDFRVISCALSWRDQNNNLKSLYYDSEDSIRQTLERLEKNNTGIVCHNLAFEYGVMKCVFPEINLNWHADTMRLAQAADNGGKKASSYNDQSIEDELIGGSDYGLGLTKCTQRWLPSTFHNHKEPYYSYIREQGIKRGKEGNSLNLLPPNMLEKYNVADTEVTLLLYEKLVEYFSSQNYDWAFDHQLYVNAAKLISDSRIEGVIVDRDKLKDSIKTITDQVSDIEKDFFMTFENQIREIELEKIELEISKRSTLHGKSNILEKIKKDPSLVKFNLSSGKDKETLFVTKLGMSSKFETTTGKPSFSKHFLKQWGKGGELLLKRGTLSQLKSQCDALLEKSEYDGKWHIDLMAAGTTTGRFKGGGGLNIQAMARKEPLLMSTIKPKDGHVFVSVDLSAGEPTITTEFSKDPYYNAATFGMVGQEPYFDDKNVLLIDDIYLMGMSVSPMGKERIRRAFYEEKFNGMSFSQAWLENPDLIKTVLKKERAFHKILILGLGYAMGPKHMVESAFKDGHTLSLKEAKSFFNAYWNLFSKVKYLGTTLENKFKKDGYILNPFGYRLIPDPSYKSLNYFIQSSVSGLINALCTKFFTIFPCAKFVTCIHDEIIFEVPISMLEDSKIAFNRALDSLNEDLGWEVKVRCGWKEGRDMFEAK